MINTRKRRIFAFRIARVYKWLRAYATLAIQKQIS